MGERLLTIVNLVGSIPYLQFDIYNIFDQR
jgi:hypothetical protein